MHRKTELGYESWRLRSFNEWMIARKWLFFVEKTSILGTIDPVKAISRPVFYRLLTRPVDNGDACTPQGARSVVALQTSLNMASSFCVFKDQGGLHVSLVDVFFRGALGF